MIWIVILGALAYWLIGCAGYESAREDFFLARRDGASSALHILGVFVLIAALYVATTLK
jgi:hypothetical protein